MVSNGMSPKTLFSNKYISNDIVIIIMLIIGICFFIFVLFEVIHKDHSDTIHEKQQKLHEQAYYHAIGSGVLQNVTMAAKKASLHYNHHHE